MATGSGIELNAELSQEALRVLASFGYFADAFPREALRAFKLRASDVKRSMVASIEKGKIETGQFTKAGRAKKSELAPQSELSKALRPDRPLGGKLNTKARQLTQLVTTAGGFAIGYKTPGKAT